MQSRHPVSVAPAVHPCTATADIILDTKKLYFSPKGHTNKYFYLSLRLHVIRTNKLLRGIPFA